MFAGLTISLLLKVQSQRGEAQEHEAVQHSRLHRGEVDQGGVVRVLGHMRKGANINKLFFVTTSISTNYGTVCQYLHIGSSSKRLICQNCYRRHHSPYN